MSTKEVDLAVRRVALRRPDLAATVQAAADALTAGEGMDMIHQATLQQFLWWYLPREFAEERWKELAHAAAELLQELGLNRLAEIARSDQTAKILDAWGAGPNHGATAFRLALKNSAVVPPDTPVLTWGSIMGSDEMGAFDAVERALANAIDEGRLVPGASGWRKKVAGVTTATLTRPLDLPPGQTLAGLVTTERVGTWIETARHPLHHKWRSMVANRLLNPIDAPTDPDDTIAPMLWLLGSAAGSSGAELTQSHYLARSEVISAIERFHWWDWEKPPRSEADVYQLGTLREAATRLRLLRRRGRRLLLTMRGNELLQNPQQLWREISTETEDREDFTHMMAELVGLRLLEGRVEQRELIADIVPIVIAQGWWAGNGPIEAKHVSWAVYAPIRWWRLFSALDEQKATWNLGFPREATPHTYALTADGRQMVLEYLRSRATGPRSRIVG